MAHEHHGRFCLYDLMTDDVQSAMAFYTELLGWSIEVFEGEQPYNLWQGPRGPLGGVMALTADLKEMGVPPHWLAYVAVGDIAASLQRAGRLGAKVLVPSTDIPRVGRFAVLSDPQGAAIGLFMAAGETPGHDGAHLVGEVSWHELATADVDAAFGFYGEMFGWKKSEDMDMGPMGPYRIFARGDDQLGGIFNKPAERPGPNTWLYYFKVNDRKAKVKAAEAGGAKLLAGPMEVPGGDQVAQLLDPQGAAFALHAAR